MSKGTIDLPPKRSKRIFLAKAPEFEQGIKAPEDCITIQAYEFAVGKEDKKQEEIGE